MGYEDVARLKMSPSRLARVRSQFISMFRYDSMFDREAGVAEAHADTLKWVFEESSGDTHTSDNFSRWLQSEDQVYWITGKPGSGKTTLMKYISGRQQRCTPHLLRWARDQPLFIATHYFWSGSNEKTKIQSSVEGLYRTLLTQILEAYPESAPHVSPRRWETFCLFSRDSEVPGITELGVMLSKAIEHVSSVAKVCLFIDGLDECEGNNDDLNDLITWVKTLNESSSVKFCLASRPWPIFDDALRDRPHLRMENCNMKDIQQYAWGRFHDDSNFRAEMRIEATPYNQILDELVTKAEGVFLWVHLVCTQLLQASSRGALGGELWQMLNELPVDMEELYAHILDNLDQKDHAAKYFRLLQTCSGRPDALIFSFSDDIGEDSEFSMKIPQNPLTSAQLQYRATELKERVNSRCRGLLSLSVEPLDSVEVTSPFDVGTIQFCHRSVRDFLKMYNIQKKLDDMLEEPFDPHLRLCSAYSARWKFCPSDPSESVRHTSIYKCAEHAKKVASGSRDMMIRVLDYLDLDFEAHSFVDDEYFGPYPFFGGNILSFTVVLGISEYVNHKIRRGQGCVVSSSLSRLALDGWASLHTWRPESQPGHVEDLVKANQSENVEWPLLLDTFLSAIKPNPEMVSLLLENGADPNLVIRRAGREKSALNVVFDRLTTDYRLSGLSGVDEAWVESLRLLLRHGAKPDSLDVKLIRKVVSEDVVHALASDSVLPSFTESPISQEIENTISKFSLGENGLDPTRIQVTIEVLWELRRCLQTELDNSTDLSSTLTVTGNSSHSWATSCREYVSQKWAEFGVILLESLESTLKDVVRLEEAITVFGS